MLDGCILAEDRWDAVTEEYRKAGGVCVWQNRCMNYLEEQE